MLDWDRAYHGSYMLHGHIHSLPPQGETQDFSRGSISVRGYNQAMREQGVRRYDVGLDANGMNPVTAEQVVALQSGRTLDSSTSRRGQGASWIPHMSL